MGIHCSPLCVSPVSRDTADMGVQSLADSRLWGEELISRVIKLGWKVLTRFWHFAHLVMPFGLCNVPVTFHHFVKGIFQDFLDCSLLSFLLH